MMSSASYAQVNPNTHSVYTLLDVLQPGNIPKLNFAAICTL